MSSPRPPAHPRWFVPLLLRLHTLAGIVVGPFLIVVALSGALYALSTPLERVVDKHELTAPSTHAPLPLADQVAAATAYAGESDVVAVRPAPSPGDTTRVMLAGEGLGESETRGIFVDPGSGEIRGDLTVYGTSGALPLRTWIDQLHRNLHLGEAGRLYSEFAASWLGVVAVAGIGLWIARVRRPATRAAVTRPRLRAPGRRRTLSWHAPAGVVLALGMLFLSATGITWSAHAGANVTALRAALDWTAPAVDTALDGSGSGSGAGEHAGHEGHAGHGAGMGDMDMSEMDMGDMAGMDGGEDSPVLYDHVLAAARDAGIGSSQVEIRPPETPGTAWVVQEIHRSYPTRVDAVAIDPTTLEVVDRADFADYPLMAKLARWGVDLHMGTLFGLVNQLAVAAVALGIAGVVVTGYVMWWQRGRGSRPGRVPSRGALRAAPWWGVLAVAAAGLVIGLFLPMIGLGLLAFLVVDQVAARLPRGAR
ncbi:PepSY domain-containing protein [Brachybacterium sp. NBEC-018]|uniref:PepSY-associated TM helix domain-containing protein n=1 Tax=Brachybacterium sp. NBEC-018 TaxID=2996004 RepID=UPI002174D9B7|nr:PepSY-associated TM helix domain-containing protein [Brachybacterium sp. NBEC-018]UVY84652.1 PepSY domain-containing protein [Brachybacterium sp. NBEC-018]